MLVWLPSEILHPMGVDAARPVMLLILYGTEHCLIPIHVELVSISVSPKLLEVLVLFSRGRVLRVFRFNGSVGSGSGHASTISH